jgi:hypothetical protein
MIFVEHHYYLDDIIFGLICTSRLDVVRRTYLSPYIPNPPNLTLTIAETVQIFCVKYSCQKKKNLEP